MDLTKFKKMEKLRDINWKEIVDGKHSWMNEHLRAHPIKREGKTVTRFYSVDFSGTQQELLTLVESMADSISHYVYDEKQLEEMQKKKIEPFRKASGFFGKTNPDMDGKYGELLLYILTEAVLKTPLVSHKLSLLTNTNDQIKGGDGIFFGEYADELSILIGESKIHKSYSGAMTDALSSLDRFHDNYSQASLGHELFIARSNISNNFSFDEMEALYKTFTPGSEEYKNCIKTHPVLLVFESDKIKTIEEKAKNKEEAEELFEKWIQKRTIEINEKLKEYLKSYPKLKTVYIDIFLLPLNDVSTFKNSLYRAIHGVDYTPTK